MSGKSIRFSIYAIISWIAVILAVIFAFKFSILVGFFSLALVFIPVKLQIVAIGEAGGKFDKFFAKFMIPLIAAAIFLIVILSVAVWIKW